MKKYLALVAAVVMAVMCIPALAEEAVDQSLLVLASSAAPLDADYAPSDLVKLVSRRNNESGKNANHGVYTVSSTSIQLRYAAADALSRMCADAESEGVVLYVRQGYRSYEDEVTRYARLEKRGETAQKPGENDYQTGLAVTLVGKAWRAKTLTEDFGNTKEAQWMAQNAARYGFVLRYPQGKQDVTGWAWEPWHLRYVGQTAAQTMQQGNLCLEEYCQSIGFDGLVDQSAPQVTAPPVTPAPTLVPEEKEPIEEEEPAVEDPAVVQEEPAETVEPTPVPEAEPEEEPEAVPEVETEAESAGEETDTLVEVVEESGSAIPVDVPEGVIILEEYGPDGDYEIILFHD